MEIINAPQRFSQREQQVVAALLEAKPVKDIAVSLNLSTNTVKDYLKTIYRKAEVHSARELMLRVARPAGTPDSGLAQLLQTAQTLTPGASPRQSLAHLETAIRRCTRARRVSFWRVVRGANETLLASESGGGSMCAGSFSQRILAHGWARLETNERRGPEARWLANLGITGEVIGVQCTAAPRVQLLLAAEPDQGSFGPFDLPMIRLFARLASSQLEQAPYERTMAAIA